MLFFTPLRWLAFWGSTFVGTFTLTAGIQTEVSVWQKVSTYLTKEALLELKDLPEPSDVAEQRERDFCAAVVTLDQQPLSESRLDEVEGRLQALLATPTAGPPPTAFTTLMQPT